MASSHWNKGTVFLYSVKKSKMLEKAVSRLRAHLGRKPVDPTSRGRSGKAKEMFLPGSVKRKQPSAKETIQDWEDIFMPELKDLADYQFRSELHRVMGSEEIRLSDKEWSHRFTKRLRENYMSCLDETERRLARNERKRLHRLRLAGILVDSVNADSHAASTGRPGSMPVDKATGRKGTGEKLKKDKSELSYFRDPDCIKIEKELFRRIQRRTYAAPKKLPGLEFLVIVEQSIDPLDSPELLTMKRLGQKPSDMSTSTELARRKKKRLPPDVAKLYENQSVKNLYALAKRLIPPLPKPVEPEPDQEENGGKGGKGGKGMKPGKPSSFKAMR